MTDLTFTGSQMWLQIFLHYLGAVHSAIAAVAAVALLLPAAAVGELQPGVVAALPDTYDWIQTEKERNSVNSESVE